MTTSASEAFCDIAAGSVGGFMAKVLDYPLDTVKVLLQTQTANAKTKYNGALDCLQQAIQQHGVSSLYRGISSPLLGSMAENAVCFLAYANIKRFIVHQHSENSSERRELSLVELSLAGAGAGVAASFVLTPVELVKCRMQVSAQQDTPLYKGPLDVLAKTWRQEGLFQGLYKGHLSTMYREVPGNFCWYGTYEIVCKLLTPIYFPDEDASRSSHSSADLPIQAHMLGGASAGVMYWTAFYPADTVKSLVQTHPEYSHLTFRQAFVKIVRADGVRGLYRGWGITALRAAPAHALIFAGYEQTLKFLRPRLLPESYHIYE